MGLTGKSVSQKERLGCDLERVHGLLLGRTTEEIFSDFRAIWSPRQVLSSARRSARTPVSNTQANACGWPGANKTLLAESDIGQTGPTGLSYNNN